ncbi:MAG: cupredoxin domain-containing protein [Acidimicrobiia bacterium]
MDTRRTIALTAFLAGGLLLAACGDDDATTTSGAASSAEEGHSDDGHDDEGTPVADGAREIEVVANDFAFEPAEITAEAGEDLAIVLTSEDMLHDFTIDELDAHVVAERGDTATGGVAAVEPGTYTYYCSVPGHRNAGMEGTLTVE